LTMHQLRCAGAPKPDSRFFCDGALGTCFNYTNTSATFNDARNACMALGGNLFMPKDARRQLMVEIYFRWAGLACRVGLGRGARDRAAAGG
jgi:hypothetical protein